MQRNEGGEDDRRHDMDDPVRRGARRTPAAQQDQTTSARRGSQWQTRSKPPHVPSRFENPSATTGRRDELALLLILILRSEAVERPSLEG
jgi:hypothetical protein